jgi:hypothetical protein
MYKFNELINMKEFKVFKDILDILKSIWISMKGSKELMSKYEIEKELKGKYDINPKF